ncbi:hypothetical protein [Leisingera sp. MMG026]|nr:hypothetical protein [Leisingera sp. MMG026]
MAHIKEMHEKAPPKPKVQTNSEKMGYKPRPCKKELPEAMIASD